MSSDRRLWPSVNRESSHLPVLAWCAVCGMISATGCCLRKSQLRLLISNKCCITFPSGVISPDSQAVSVTLTRKELTAKEVAQILDNLLLVPGCIANTLI